MSSHTFFQLICIDSTIKNVEHLINGVSPDAEVVILNDQQDGVEQISSAFARHSIIDSVHIVSHGTPGTLLLGSTELSWKTLFRYAGQIQQWAKVLLDKEILLYGCNVAAGVVGLEFVDQLSMLTGAKVAASTTPTGNAAQGGNWNLNVQTGKISSPLAFRAETLASYPHTLAPDAIPNLVYAISGDKVYFTSTQTGQSTNPTSPAGNPIPNTLAFATNANARDALSAENLLYYVGASTNRLGTWNPVTGVATNLAAISGATLSGAPRLAFRANGQLYVMNSNNLYTISTGTGLGIGNTDPAGTATLVATIANLPTGGGGDMAFDPSNPDVLYIAGTSSNSLYTVTFTGSTPSAATLIGAMGASSPGLAFGADGNLYGSNGNNIVRVNITNGSTTTVGNTGNGISDFATLPTPSPDVDLNVMVTDSNTTTAPGSPVTYTITVTNTSGFNVYGVSVKDLFNDPNLTGTANWSAAAAPGVSFPTSADQSGTGDINVKVNLQAGATVTYTITGLSVSPTATGSISNTATVTPPEGVSDNASNPGANSATDTTSILLTDTTAPVVTVNGPITTADGTPALSGTVDDPTATVKVTVNGVEYTAVNNGNGTWTLADNTIAPALTSGTYDVQAVATDTLGNVGTDTTTSELIVDRTAPVVTVNGPITTADGTPALSGTVDDPTAVVKVTVNGVEYTATNNGNGTWTLADNTIAPALTSGTYDVQAVATDTLGNAGTDTTTSELIVDRTAPVVTVNGPTATADGTPALSGTVDDPTATVKVTVNGVEYTAVNNGNGTWTLADNTIAPALTSGTYDVQAVATDALGNTGTDTTTGELIVDRTAPVVTVNGPTTTADGTPALSGTVDDPTATVKVTVNGVEYTATNNGNGTWTLADNTIAPALTSGTYDVQAVATDTLGNVGTDTTTGELIVDRTAPVVTVNGPTTTADGTPALSGTVDDPTATVKVTVNGVEYTATNNGNGTWTLADNTIAPALTSGTYDVQAVATDTLGNVGTDATTGELIVDRTAPVVTVNGPTTTADGTPALSGTVDDPTAVVKVTVNGVEYTVTNNGDGTWTLADNTIAPALTSGTYDVQAVATDTLGNVGTDTTTSELIVDRTAPIVTVNGPTTTADGTPALSGTVDDPTAVVKVTVNGVEYTATNNGNGTWTLPNDTINPSLVDGIYDVQVTATDTLGNTGTDSTSQELTIDSTAPTVTITPLVTSDATPPLTGTVDDPAAVIQVTVNGQTYTAINNGNGTWTLPNDTIATALTNGVYDVKVTATNTLGSIGSDTTNNELVIDRTAPVVTITPSNTADTTPQLTGTVDDPTAVVTVTVNGQIYTAINNGDGTWTLPNDTINPALTNGTYDVSVSATDPSGNTGVDTTADELIIDSTLPQVIIKPIDSTTGEDGSTGTFEITLNRQPTADVVLTLSSSDPTEGTLALTTFTFTPANWNTPQIVTVMGVDDAAIDGEIPYRITINVASNDRKYNNLVVTDVTVSNIDNDTLMPNQSPVTPDATTSVISGSTTPVTGLTATDTDGTIAAYQITSLPTVDQGTLFLGNPASGGTPIQNGQTLTPAQVSQLFFQPTSSFTGSSFSYTAIDNSGQADPTPALMTLKLAMPPVATDVALTLSPGSDTNIAGLIATDPDGEIAAYLISSLPPVEQGILFIGNPASGGTPVTAGQMLSPSQIRQLVFRSTGKFSGTSFEYTAVDDTGTVARIPAKVVLSQITCQTGISLRGTRRKDGLIGTSGIDRLRGRKGNDNLRGLECNDVLLGGRGKDKLFGHDGRDVLHGGVGKDKLRGGTDRDVLRGGRGKDVLFGGKSTDRLRGGQRQDRLNGNEGSDLLFGGLGRDTLRGGADSDFAKGNRGNDLLRGGGGNDILSGNRSNDRLWGGKGSDKLNGGLNRDRLNGSKGNDILFGRRGNDQLWGHQGDDLLNGGLNNDRLWGREGRDRLQGGRGKDRLQGGMDKDILNGGLNRDRLNGNQGNDTLLGRRGNDQLRGRQGDDLLNGGLNRDRLWGGTGDDLLVGGGNRDVLTGGAGSDQFIYTSLKDRGDRIRDFVPTEDVINLQPLATKLNARSFNELVNLTQVGSSTVVEINAKGDNEAKLSLVTLENVKVNALGTQNFLI